MSLKSFIGKVFSKKEESSSEPPMVHIEEQPTQIQPEISFAKTMVETALKNNSLGEIEIYVNNEKTNIFDVASTLRIGRDPAQTDISIPELIVSKSHCTIYVKENEVWIKDNSSTNGTFVNRQRITDVKLEDNDVIMLGKKGTVRINFHIR